MPPQTYSGPDDENASVSGSCVDRAGNTTTEVFGLSYDATGPVVTATPSRAPDSNGWYNHGLSVSFAGTDATSGLDSCVPPQSYAGPDSANASVPGSCLDRAGNSTVELFALSYDATAPTVTGANASRGPDHARLVQPRAVDRLHRGGRDLGDRFLHAGELLGPRLAERLGLGHVP